MKLTCFALSLIFLIGCAESDPAAQTSPGAVPEGTAGQEFKVDGDFAGAHILVAYQGAQRANPEITRTKEEALAKAMDLIAQLKDSSTPFAEFAAENSDGPSAANGGSLGAWKKGAMVPEFDTAIEGLEIGAVTEEPVETAFGYHIIKRNGMTAPFWGADAIFIGVAGQAPPTVTRNQAGADSLAEALASEVNADNFDEMANAHNDFGDGPTNLGAVKDNDPQVPPPILEALKGLAIGDVAGPVSYPGGYVFLRRTHLEQRAGAHILIAWAGAERAGPEVKRTKEDAFIQAKGLAERVFENPDSFAEMARLKSDGPSKATGGDLGVWFKGQMVPEFDEAIDNMDVGEITDEPVESAFGYHIIKRLPVE